MSSRNFPKYLLDTVGRLWLDTYMKHIPTIDHPTGRTNFTVVDLGDVAIAFSYKTIVGVRVGWTWTTIQNYWSNTTGKHLNILDDGDKASRLSADDFDQFVAEHVTGRSEDVLDLPRV